MTAAGLQPRRPVLGDWSWQWRGDCMGVPTDVFFPDDARRRDQRANEERAKRICRRCPVLAECHRHAINAPETYGIWGATTPRERAESIAALHDGRVVTR